MLSYIIISVAAALLAAVEPIDNSPKEGPLPHQVIAIYFHRTVRCPTCKRIGALVEDAVAKGFAKEVEVRTVEFRLLDFQDKKNAELAEAYKIAGPTLVLANVFDGKVIRWEPLPKVWQLVGKPAELTAYVQDGVAKYLKQTKEEAESKQ